MTTQLRISKIPTGGLRRTPRGRPGQLTPHAAAKAYARAYPDRAGIVEVVSLQPKGKGGRRGLGSKRTLFVFMRGEAAPLRDFRQQGTFSGRCRVCGRLCLGGALRWAYDAEGRYVPGACDRCVLDNSLSTVRPRLVLPCPNPTGSGGQSPLARFGNDLCARLDIRAAQGDSAQRPSVEVLAEARKGGAE